MLIKYGREQGITGFSADVLCDNKAMLKVYEKLPFTVQSKFKSGAYHLTINFQEDITSSTTTA